MTENQELKKQLEFQLQILNSVQQPVIVTDTNAKVILWNDFAEKLYGFTKNEAIGKTTIELIAPVERIKENIEKFEEIKNGNKSITEYLVKNKSGKEFSVSLAISPIFNSENEVVAIVGTSHEITEEVNQRKELIKAKEKAEQSEGKYRILFENFNAAISIYNKDYKIVMMNQYNAEILGGEISDFIGKSLYDLFPNEADKHTLRFDKIIETNRGGIFEDAFYLPNGKTQWFSSIIQPIDNIGIQIVAFDITEKKKIELELIKAKEKAEENEKRWLSLTNNTNDAIILIDINYIVKDINKTFLPQSKNDVVGTSIYKYVAEEYHANMRETFEKVIQTRWPDVYETKLDMSAINPELPTYWHTTKVTPLINNSEITGFILIATDITHRKIAEFELINAKQKAEESEKRFRSIIENTQAGYFFIDNKGLFQKVNEAWLDLYKYESFEEVIGVHFATVQQIEDIESADQFVEGIRKGNPDFMIGDFSRKCKDGSLGYHSFSARPVYENNTVIGIEGFIIDITKQKEIEIELKKAKEKAEKKEQEYFSLFNEMINGFAYHKIILDENNNPCDYTFLNVNPAFERLTGLKAKDIIGKTELEVMPNIEKYWAEIYGKVALTGESIQFENFASALNKYYSVVAYSPEKGYFATIFEDITERKLAEIALNEKNEELEIAKQKAEESDRLKTAFLQNMSHEIRTPLNAISGFSGMLNKPELVEEKRKSFVSIIQNSSKQLVSIVSDILTISSLETKQEKLKIDKVCINNIIVELLAIFRQQSQNQNISLYAKQQLSDRQSEIYTDKTKITQILTNLLTNALKFTHNGFIEFGYQFVETHGRASLQYNSEIQFYVKDSGIGINPEFHEKIFERFRQANENINVQYGGTGLGLAISKAFAELLGGRIWVQSELEKGSTFYFTIPYKPVNEIDKATTPTKQNENFRTVLVAEDEEYNFLFIEEILIEMDLNIIHAKDGKETVDIFKSNPNIDLILMDIKMPIMDGHEAAKIIKQLNPNLPIIAQSAYALVNERAKYEGIFDDYLTKPINKEDLIEKVNKYIENK